MSEYGLRIKTIKAGTLYGYNLGVRTHYDYTEAMFNNSLFSKFIRANGLTDHKDESTRDIICINFDFGSRSYEEERAHIDKLLTEKPDDEKLLKVSAQIDENKDKYDKKSKDEIREIFYRDGVDVTYTSRNNNPVVIHYKMLYRNASKAKVGQCMFIREALWKKAIDWLTMDLYDKMPNEKAKIVEMSAYAPLTTSTIVGYLHIPVENMLILEDKDSFFTTMSNIVTAEDYTDAKGNIKKKCVVKREVSNVKNTLWDGMGLIDIDSCHSIALDHQYPPEINGMVLLRGHMFKACMFKTRLQLFFKDWCGKNGHDYETYQVNDMFGRAHYLKDIQMITTDNAIKFKKFSNLMGDDPYQYWCDKVNADGSFWGIVKTDHPSKLGNVQQMSYQMVNTMPCTDDDVREICGESIEYVESLKKYNDEFESFLRKNANTVNHYEMLADLYDWNHEFANSDYFRREKSRIISQYVFSLRGGKITVTGDNLTCCGNPYALLLYSVGESWENDPTLSQEQGCIQCYTPRFKHGEYLCGFRNPHNSPNNVSYLHNIVSEEMEKYFVFSKNIIAVNNIGTDIQARMNGMDYDSDFMLVTNHPTIVRCAKKCYSDYPTIVNELKESGLTYDKTPEQYALMDIRFARSQRAIGESSNLAQLAMTYYWSDLANHIESSFDRIYLYDNFVILSVLAQVAIDGIKRSYEIDVLDEIDRIKKMPCMIMTDYNGDKKDFPMFMKYTKEVPTTKNGRELPYETIVNARDKIKSRINYDLKCPMNYLQRSLDKIQGASKTNTTPTKDFFINMVGRAHRRQVWKIISLADEYQAWITHHSMYSSVESWAETVDRTNKFYDDISKIKIGSAVTINRLISIALDLDVSENLATKKFEVNANNYCRVLLKALHKTNKDKFLSCFVRL